MILHNAGIMHWLLHMFSSGVVLEAGKDVTFNPEDDDAEHQLDLRMVPIPPLQRQCKYYFEQRLKLPGVFMSPHLL